jgi:beta-phosphoglucomutase-like phosphatase (HAD superfamily)
MFKKLFDGKKVAIFDLNGTVVKESEEIKRQAFERVLNEEDLSFVDVRKIYTDGFTIEELWSHLINMYEIQNRAIKDLVDKTEKAFIDIVDKTPLETTEGFWELFEELKFDREFKTAVVTNSSKKVLEKILDKIEAKNTFDIELSLDDVKKPKPDPEIYIKALQKLNAKPEQAVAFEDSIYGALAAGNAKIDTAIIWDGVVIKSRYEGRVMEITNDFSPYPGNLDLTHLEYLAKSYKETKEK